MQAIHLLLARLVIVVGGFCVFVNSAYGVEKGKETLHFAVAEVAQDLDEAQLSNLSTPQGALEHFLMQADQGHWQEASLVLSYRFRTDDVEKQTAAEHARKLHYLLRHNLWIDWSQVPDRPDGMLSGSVITGEGPMVGERRRSIALGSIALDGREIPIRLERIKPESKPARWMFAAQTVDNIDTLYDLHGPHWIATQLPDWAHTPLFWKVPLWQWGGLLLVLIITVLLGWLISRLVLRFIAKQAPHARTGEFVETIRKPTTVVVCGIVGYSSFKALLTLPAPVSGVIPVLLIAVITVGATWLAVAVINFFVAKVVHKHVVGEMDEASVDERGVVARLTIARYGLILITAAVGISFLLMSLDMFRVMGIALLSSAGAAAVVLGLAGHAVLGNLIAGIQIAFTQPFRIGDTVYIEDNWGRIEDLKYTFVVVRTWDHRRLIFPIRYFTTHWFENWSKTERHQHSP